MLAKAFGQDLVKPGGYAQAEVRVIGFKAQHIVGLTGDDVCGNGLLAAHGINGDDAAFNAQELEQLGNGGDFIGLLSRPDLPE